MRLKRGQVTLYIGIAVLIIAIFVVGFLIYNHIKKTTLSSSEINLAKQEIKTCFEIKAKEGILFISRQGGYYELPDSSINFLDEKTAFYLKDGKNLVPSKRAVERQLELWLYDNANACLDLQTVKTEKNFTVEVRLLETNETEIKVKEIKIKKADASALIDFSIILKADLLKFLNVSNEIVEEYEKTISGYICIECMDNIALKHDVNLTIVPITKEIFRTDHVWFLINSTQKIDNSSIIWRFVTELK